MAAALSPARRILPHASALWQMRLPHDYEALDDEGQRLARLNACRQWTLPDATADDYVASVNAFDVFYLRPEESNFYDMPPLPSPLFHTIILRSMFSNPLNVFAAPRGGAKSKLIHRANLTELVTRPKWSIIHAGSTHRQIKKAIDSMMGEIVGSKLLHDDWAPAYGGRLRPKRGEALFGLSEYSRLTNGSNITFTSMDSRNRGGRPRKFRLDDPEYDPEAETSMSRLQEEMDRFIFKIIMPMLRNDCGVDWAGTTVSKAHLLWKAVTLDDNGQPKDPRFAYWNRMLFKVLSTRPDGSIVSLWEEMWPASKMEALRAKIGAANFATEYMNEPGLDSGRSFDLDTTPHGRHAWWLTDSNGAQVHMAPSTLRPSDPLYINWKGKGDTVEKATLSDFLQRCDIFMCCDYIRSPSPTSDFATSFVFAVHPGNILFVLDGWAARVTEGLHTGQILHHIAQWNPRIVGIEAPNLFHSLLHRVRTDLSLMTPTTSPPEVRAIPQHGPSKSGKIDALRWRLEGEGLLKMPLFAHGSHPWTMLFSQFKEFNATVDDGGLEHDDCIDTVAMTQRLLLGSRQPEGEKAKPPTILERLRRGETHDNMGNPLIEQVAFNSLTRDDIDAISHHRREPLIQSNCI